jgi:hypothetical protein
LKPARKRSPRHLAGREIRHGLFLLVDGRFDGESMQIKEDGRRGMGDALVAIDERVVHRKSKRQCAGLVHDRGLEVGAVEGGFGLGERRLERKSSPWPVWASASESFTVSA